MWKELYEKTLKNICEADANEFEEIIEQERPEFSVDLIENPNANENSLFKFKLDDNATEEDYKKFVEYVYNYVGQDVNDYLPQEQNENQEGENTEMDANKIRTLLKRYGAEDNEIENFMEDLENLKDEIEEDDDFNYLDNDTMEKLKATEEGKDLIINAPKMAKEELKAAIKKYLSNAQ